MLHLNRELSQNNNGYDLLKLDLNNPYFDNIEGAYIIWHGGVKPRVVRVGQGKIGERLSIHRENGYILFYRNFGLYVTWASVEAQYRDGVERFLGDTYNPLVGERFPDCVPISVNLP